MPQNYKNQPSINRFNFARWYQDKNLFQNAEFAIGSGNNFTNWSKIIPTHTNLCAYSSEFDNAYYSKTGTAVTANAIADPYGNLTADKLYPTSTGSDKRIFSTFTVSIGTSYVSSIYVKKGEKSYVGLYGVNILKNAVFNLTNGTIAFQSSGLTAGIELIGNSWYRIWVSEIATSTTGYLYTTSLDNTSTVTANGTDGIYIWGAQFEVGSKPTSYIPTTTTSITAEDGEIIPATRTNLLLYNTNFNSGWSGNSAFTFTNNQIGAYGINTAQKVEAYSTTGTTISISTTLSLRKKYTFSYAIKKGNTTNTLNDIFIYNNTKAINIFSGKLNLDTKVLTTLINPYNAVFNKIELNSEWTLIYVTFENGFAAGDNLKFYLPHSGGSPTIGSYVYIDSPQLEYGDYPTFPITTGSSTITVNDGINTTRAVRLDRGVTSGLAINQASVLDAAGNYKLSFWAKKASVVDPSIRVLSETSTFDTINITTTYYKKYEVILPALTPDNQVSLYNNVENSSVVIDNARLELVQEGVSIGTPNPYYLDPGRLSFPILTATDNFQFYLNADTPITGYTKSDLIPILCNENGIREYTWSTSVLNEISVGAGVHYYSNSIPLSVLSALSEGLYYFAIYNNATGNILWTTNYFYLYRSGYEDFSSAVKFRNYKNIFKVQYETLTDFYQQFRIMLVEKEVNYGGEKNQYREISTGAYRTTQVYDERVVRAETYYFDREMHEAMDNMTRHDTITINSKSYIAKGNYEPNLDQTSKISKGEIELIDQEFSQINS